MGALLHSKLYQLVALESEPQVKKPKCQVYTAWHGGMYISDNHLQELKKKCFFGPKGGLRKLLKELLSEQSIGEIF